MLQPAYVLPSNAPPFQEGHDGLQQASRVLQEHSGNRQQHHDFGLKGDWDQSKYLYDQQTYLANALAGGNVYARHHVSHQQSQHRHLHHPQPRYRNAWRYGHGYPRAPWPLNEAQVQYDAEQLYRRFEKSDQYVKYRARQVKDDKGNGDQKWPDHLEKAFFRALITWPPMGRRKHLHKEKQRGRNELIADCIEELTGESRTRKQVSSHIQVLKPFVEHDKAIMKWLSKDDMMAQPGRYPGHSHPSGRRMSNYPVTAPPHSMRSAMPSLPRTDAFGVQQLKQSQQAFEPADFQMFLQRKYREPGKEEEIDRLHTYSQAIKKPQAEDHHMTDWTTLARDFPHLAKANAQRPLDCNVIIAEASLAFPMEPMEKWKGHPSATIELGIYFQCRSHHLPIPRAGMKSTVSLRNQFFPRGLEHKDDHSETTEVYFHPVPDSSAVETEIKFGSKFWARTLGHVGNKLREPMGLSVQQRHELAEYVRSLAAVQEVFIATERGPERIMVIHWNFRLSSETCGSARWRRLILPDAASTTSGVYTAPHALDPQAKPERAGSFYDYTTSLPDLSGPYQQQQPPPTLQSPFEYDASSSGGSALSSTTWPTTLSEHPVPGDFGGDALDNNAFDFHAGAINIAYDPSLPFDAFDSSAFNFDADVDVDVDFAADPALGDFDVDVGGVEGWYDDAFESQQGSGVHVPVGDIGGGGGGDGGSFATQPDLDAGVAQMYGGFHDGQHGTQASFAAPSQHDQQAYGGAGPEGIKEEDALAALADASAWASGLGTKQWSGNGERA